MIDQHELDEAAGRMGEAPACTVAAQAVEALQSLLRRLGYELESTELRCIEVPEYKGPKLTGFEAAETRKARSAARSKAPEQEPPEPPNAPGDEGPRGEPVTKGRDTCTQCGKKPAWSKEGLCRRCKHLAANSKPGDGRKSGAGKDKPQCRQCGAKPSWNRENGLCRACDMVRVRKLKLEKELAEMKDDPERWAKEHPKKACQTIGCHGHPVARGLCTSCYAAAMRHGKLEEHPKLDGDTSLEKHGPTRTRCAIGGCQEKPFRHGLCKLHLIEAIREGCIEDFALQPGEADLTDEELNALENEEPKLQPDTPEDQQMAREALDGMDK
jgi:ribosomal protein S14